MPTSVCVNKWDIDAAKSVAIERNARAAGAYFAGRIRYDRGVTEAQMRAETAVEAGVPSAADIRAVWGRMAERLAVESVNG